MQSIRELYRIGNGPSSSHSMGPRIAAERFKSENPEAASFKITLYGSLAATGKGHLTDKAVAGALEPAKLRFKFLPDVFMKFHPNAMRIEAMKENWTASASRLFFSIGGGEVLAEGEPRRASSTYPIVSMDELLKWCRAKRLPMWRCAQEFEGPRIFDHLSNVWNAMQESILRGLDAHGILPGGLKLQRRAASFHSKALGDGCPGSGLLFAFALSAAEENASGSVVVTAPTCGSCGVLPAVLKFLQKKHKIKDKSIIQALATAGLVGNLIRHNASISGAEVGCQGEIGSACSMAAAAAAQLLGGNCLQIEYAAEMGMEHHLGLTCDPVMGLVQIPCIERNAFAAATALTCAEYALLSDGEHRISFDNVVETMRRTGRDMKSTYRETSKGGLAKLKSRLEQRRVASVQAGVDPRRK